MLKRITSTCCGVRAGKVYKPAYTGLIYCAFGDREYKLPDHNPILIDTRIHTDCSSSEDEEEEGDVSEDKKNAQRINSCRWCAKCGSDLFAGPQCPCVGGMLAPARYCTRCGELNAFCCICEAYPDSDEGI